MKTKSIFIFFVISMFFISLKVNCQSYLNWRGMITKSKVKSLNILKYGYEFGEPIKDGLKYSDTLYDISGKVIKSIQYSLVEGPSNVPENTIIYKYDSIGLILEKNYYYFSSEKVSNIDFFKYKTDDQNNVIEKARYNKDGVLKEKYVYKFEKGKNIEQTYFSESSRSITNSLKYDVKGRLINDYRGSTYYSYQYDNNNNIILIFESDGINEPPSKKHEFKYEGVSKLVETVSVKSSNAKTPYVPSRIFQYIFNEKNLIVEIITIDPEINEKLELLKLSYEVY